MENTGLLQLTNSLPTLCNCSLVSTFGHSIHIIISD